MYWCYVIFIINPFSTHCKRQSQKAGQYDIRRTTLQLNDTQIYRFNTNTLIWVIIDHPSHTHTSTIPMATELKLDACQYLTQPSQKPWIEPQSPSYFHYFVPSSISTPKDAPIPIHWGLKYIEGGSSETFQTI